jgi:hypothetical protein
MYLDLYITRIYTDIKRMTDTKNGRNQGNTYTW